MDYVSLGSTGLQVSRLGLGGSRIASLSTAYPPSVVRQTLNQAFDAGVNFYDTADVYGQGDSERMLGKLFRGRRSDVVLCTKAGLTLSWSQSLIRMVKPILNPALRHWSAGRQRTIEKRQESERQCFDPDFLRMRIEGSLRRMGTDYIDVFLLHSPPASVVHDEMVRRLLEDMRADGKLRYIGVSCDTEEVALAALQWDTLDCLQLPIHIGQRAVIDKVLPAAVARNVGVIAREPLAGGAVLHDPAVESVAQQYPGLGASCVAIKYVLQQAGVHVVLTGTSNPQHLRDNLALFDSDPLSDADMNLLAGVV